MGVVGNRIYGSGDVFVLCSNGDGNGAFPMSFTGSIAADGKFTLTNGSQSSIPATIQGQVPSVDSSNPNSVTWPGTYTLAATGCNPGPSGNFTATLYPPLEGTYAGTISGPNSSSGQSSSPTALQLTAQISQGAFATETVRSNCNRLHATERNYLRHGLPLFHFGDHTNNPHRDHREH